MRHFGLALLLLLAITIGCQEDDEAITPPVAVDTTMIDPTVAIDIEGYVQKGPFINGTSMIISELDDSLAATGKTFTTQIVDNQGSFSIKTSQTDHTNLQLTASGFYFDEVKGEKSSAQLTLFALADVSQDTVVNVNILSHLEFNRVAYLIQQEGKNFREAKKQAQQEVLAIFGISGDEVRSSERLDIAKEGEDNAILLAASVILQANNTVAELSELLANLSTDLKEDGLVNTSVNKDKINEQAKLLDLPQIRQHLEKRYQDMDVKATIPAFEKYIDSDGDGILNKDEDDTPDDFTFEPQMDVTVDTLVVSNEITIRGLKEGGKSVAYLEGGTLIVNDQKVIGDSTHIANGDRIKLALQSSPEYATSLVAKLTINTFARPFSVTTDNYTPNDFSFTVVENAQRDSLYTSEVIELNGLPHTTPVSLDEGTLLINGQATTSGQNSVKNGDEIAVRLLASSEYETEVTATVQIGAISKSFKVRTVLNPWQRKADGPSEGIAGRFFINNKVYIIGFETMNVYQYDPDYNQWTTKSTFPGKSRGGSASFTIKNKAYFGLGFSKDDDGMNNDLWEYNPLTDLWTQKANFPGENLGSPVAFTLNDKGYVGTGYRNDESEQEPWLDSRQFWEYNPIYDQWERKADFPGEARSRAAGFAIEDKGYIGAGHDSHMNAFNDFWEYDPSANNWARKTSFNEQLNSSEYGSYGFTVGKQGYFVQTFEEKTVRKYNSSLDKWIEVENWVENNDEVMVGAMISGPYKTYMLYYGNTYDTSTPTQFWQFTPSQD